MDKFQYSIKSSLLILLCFISTINASAQVASNYNLSLEQITISGFPGLQSYASAQHDGKWLLIGGRTDGLHRRQPFASFAASDNNTDIMVISPSTNQFWSASINNLPSNLKEQLQSSNMQSIQQGNTLYLIGGYGYSATIDDHITYDKLTAVKVDSIISAVLNNTSLLPCFRQISDTIFAVTGGQIGKIDSAYYLVGGQKFDGRYNPMGPTHGPGFSQRYINQIRNFKLYDDGINLSLYDVSTITDTTNLHRRDYNMLPQIFPGNIMGFTAFSGVFQAGVDLPYLNSVDIFPGSYNVNNSFTQYLNHYHCAKVSLFDSVIQKTENIFFGGISQYYDSSSVLVQDNNVPFTKSITNVSRDNSGFMSETKIAELPGYLGAGAEFFANPLLPQFENGILKSDQFIGDTIILGYIAGGITSSMSNVFWINTGAESDASSSVYKVILTKTSISGTNPSIPQHPSLSQLQIFPNPSNEKFQLSYFLSAPLTYSLQIFDTNGKLLKSKKITNNTIGKHVEEINLKAPTGTYFLTITTETNTINRKIIID
jgi:hypothetical protein